MDEAAAPPARVLARLSRTSGRGTLGRMRMTDAGLETVLLFDHGIELPDFAAWVVLDDAAGRDALAAYYRGFLDAAREQGVELALDTPTWRASRDWVVRQGRPASDVGPLNARAVAFVRGVADEHGTAAVVTGAIGPRGDGYVAGEAMSPEAATEYHGEQAAALAAAGADQLAAYTMTNVAEAVGVARACAPTGLPLVLSFTIETDGRLPDGTDLGVAIEAVDAAAPGAVAHVLVNCVHPIHLAPVLAVGGAWTARLGGVRVNGSAMSHAELDEAEELHAEAPEELARQVLALRRLAPGMRTLGGCCGTDHRHVAAICAAWARADAQATG